MSWANPNPRAGNQASSFCVIRGPAKAASRARRRSCSASSWSARRCSRSPNAAPVDSERLMHHNSRCQACRNSGRSRRWRSIPAEDPEPVSWQIRTARHPDTMSRAPAAPPARGPLPPTADPPAGLPASPACGILRSQLDSSSSQASPGWRPERSKAASWRIISTWSSSPAPDAGPGRWNHRRFLPGSPPAPGSCVLLAAAGRPAAAAGTEGSDRLVGRNQQASPANTLPARITRDMGSTFRPTVRPTMGPKVPAAGPDRSLGAAPERP